MITGDVDAMCYACTCALESVREERDALGRDYCKHYEDDNASAGLWFLVGTVIVVLLNQVIKFAVIFTTPFGKPHTISVQMMQTTTRYAFYTYFAGRIAQLLFRRMTMAQYKSSVSRQAD